VVQGKKQEQTRVFMVFLPLFELIFSSFSGNAPCRSQSLEVWRRVWSAAEGGGQLGRLFASFRHRLARCPPRTGPSPRSPSWIVFIIALLLFYIILVHLVSRRF
jgi:hypothetical protein